MHTIGTPQPVLSMNSSMSMMRCRHHDDANFSERLYAILKGNDERLLPCWQRLRVSRFWYMGMD